MSVERHAESIRRARERDARIARLRVELAPESLAERAIRELAVELDRLAAERANPSPRLLEIRTTVEARSAARWAARTPTSWTHREALGAIFDRWASSKAPSYMDAEYPWLADFEGTELRAELDLVAQEWREGFPDWFSERHTVLRAPVPRPACVPPSRAALREIVERQEGERVLGEILDRLLSTHPDGGGSLWTRIAADGRSLDEPERLSVGASLARLLRADLAERRGSSPIASHLPPPALTLDAGRLASWLRSHLATSSGPPKPSAAPSAADFVI